MGFEALRAAGGLGLFLLGMVIMTEGLRGLAGDALQRTLRRFTRSPASGAAVGALGTAVVQSSSITTVSAVGFASAGLLSFPEALGIVFGANVGTTLTGWMVALLGFKVQLGLVMPLAILAGVLMRVLGRGRVAAAGYALAGFGLVFVGIDVLREGMLGLEGSVTPDSFPSDTVTGRLQLVAIGVAITLVTQSSSAGVATALAAVSAGAIHLPQAAAMVIGMDVGTTVTAALATVGASLPGRRTGWAHVLYNVLTGAVAFAILPGFMVGLETLFPGVTKNDPELALVGFHTFFNAVGVVAILPAARPFARFIERVVPERPAPFTERLDRSLLSEPAVALRAVAPTLRDLARQSFELLVEQLRSTRPPDRAEDRALLALALDSVRSWLARIETPRIDSAAEAREVTALHVLDQLQRLLDRESQAERASTVCETPELREYARNVLDALDAPLSSGSHLGTIAAGLAHGREAYRAETLGKAGRDEIDSSDALARLDGYRWLERVTYHAWRIAHHLEQLAGEGAPYREVEPPEPD